MKKTTYLLALALTTLQASAQTTFSAIEYVDINKIKAAVLLHGDLWWDPSTGNQACEFPKGSGIHLAHASAIWMAGYDQQAQLHVSAQTYRQSGNDYWPGPLDANGTLNYATSSNWARIWKVNKTTIDSFRSAGIHTPTNTAPVILEWPAKNNPNAKGANNTALTITTDMAPFVDVNHDGKYNALDGDYPDIKGDQMLWWVFSDNGPTHNNSSAPADPLQIEIHASAYAYKRNTLMDNVIYYEYDMFNRSKLNYQDFRCGIRADMDLGNPFDDYVGFDSTRRLGYTYNGRTQDGSGSPGQYDYNIPIAGVTLLRMPGDSPSSHQPVGSFMYHNNDNSPMGNPDIANDYNHYLRATWRDNVHLKNDFVAPHTNSKGRPPGPDVNYAFPGNPTQITQWTECSSDNAVGERKFILASNDYTFNAGTHTLFALALVTTEPGTGHACPNTNFTDILDVTDTATGNFGSPLAVKDAHAAGNAFKIYPNPVTDKLVIEATGNKAGEIVIYDAMGRVMKHEPVNGKTMLNISYLPAGVYHIRYKNDEIQQAASFLKE